MKGRKQHIDRLKRLSGKQVIKAANRVVYVGADLVRAEAFNSISRGSVSGKNHVPSAPGEPPNRDTGVLQAHLVTENIKPLVAEVRSEAEYAGDLEFGSEDVAARPYMRPARDKEKPKIERLFAEQIGKLVKRSG